MPKGDLQEFLIDLKYVCCNSVEIFAISNLIYIDIGLRSS